MRMQAHLSRPVASQSRFLVGRDAHGRWVVRDREGLIGGLFTDRAAAVHFALEESDRIPGAVACAPDEAIISLDPIFETKPKAN
jgi:hypothetical protein